MPVSSLVTFILKKVRGAASKSFSIAKTLRRDAIAILRDLHRMWSYNPSAEMENVLKAIFPNHPEAATIFSGKSHNVGLDHHQIKQKMIMIHEKSPHPPTAVDELYELPAWMKQDAIATDFSEQSLQKIANHMAAFLGILMPVTVKVIARNNDSRHAGHYKVNGQWQREICIFRNKEFKIENFIAILAHESTHHYMHEHNLDDPNPAQNEILTDLTAVYLGFGELLYHGYHTSRTEFRIIGFNEHHVHLGYIPTNAVMIAGREAARLRGWLVP